MFVVVDQDTLAGIGLGGLAIWDGVGWENVLDDQPQLGHGSISHNNTPSA